jgi:signal transduction histidine kinase
MSLHDLERLHDRLRTVADPIAFLVNLFAHAPVGFAVWTADGAALLTNAAFFDLFRSEPPPGYNVLEDDVLAQSGMLSLFQRAFAGETVHVPTFWYDPRDLEIVSVEEGRRVAISMTIFPLFDSTGALEYVAATYKDETEITLSQERINDGQREIRRLNDDLEGLVLERTAQLATASRELESFSYSVAHELRAPLRGMSGFASILAEDYGDKLGREGLEHLSRIVANAHQAGELIDALLSLTRVTRGELQPTWTDLSAIAQSVTQDLASAEGAQAPRVTIQPGLWAQIDPALARMLLESVLGNAWKFTRETPDARIDFSSSELDGARVFQVRDNGAGFDMAFAPKLFAPFQRLHAVGEFPGVGMGLARAAHIVDRHGGKIWGDGAVGRGATIFFTLPQGKHP